MASKRKIVNRLEDLSFKRVCRDTVRHSVKYQAEIDKELSLYLVFQRIYNHNFLDELYKNSNFLEENTTASTFTDCVNFIFNPLVEKINLQPNVDFNEEIASVISANCKKLWHLTITKKTLPLNFCVDSLKSMKSLVVLNLSACSFETIPLMTAIADSLLHLKVLDLNETNVDDEAVFVLCGHGTCSCGSMSVCSFLKNCRVKSNLGLHHLALENTNISPVGLACVLTHLPTLKNIKVHCYQNSCLKLSNVIRDINLARKIFGMPSLQFQLEVLDFMDNLEVLKACLHTCPKLIDLCVSLSNFEPHNVDAAGKVLEESELNYLEKLNVQIVDIDAMCTGNFKRFWKRRGPQLDSICMFNLDKERYAECDLDVLRWILASCQGLSHLHLINVCLRAPNVGTTFSDDFPVLPDLDVLCLGLQGEDADFVSRAARKLILSTRNIQYLCLDFTVSEKILFPCMSERYLPCLNELVVKGRRTAETVKAYLDQKSITVIPI